MLEIVLPSVFGPLAYLLGVRLTYGYLVTKGKQRWGTQRWGTQKFHYEGFEKKQDEWEFDPKATLRRRLIWAFAWPFTMTAHGVVQWIKGGWVDRDA